MKKIVLLALIIILCVPSFSSCYGEQQTTTQPTKEPIYWGIITGVIIENGNPIEGVTITSGSRTTTTDSKGKYTIEIYDDGAIVSFTKDGYFTRTQEFKSSSFYRDEIEFNSMMYQSINVFGKIIDENGSPVENATVTIADQSIITDADGRYEFDSIIGTSMVVNVAKDGKSGMGAFFTSDIQNGECEIDDIVIK